MSRAALLSGPSFRSTSSPRNVVPRRQTRWLVALLTLALSVVAVGLADALVETDEEQLREISLGLEAQAGVSLDPLMRHVDTERQAVTLRTEQGRRLFESRDAALSDALRAALGTGPFERVQESVRVSGAASEQSAVVATRLRDAEGLVDVSVSLAQEGARWWVTDIAIR